MFHNSGYENIVTVGNDIHFKFRTLHILIHQDSAVVVCNKNFLHIVGAFGIIVHNSHVRAAYDV